MKAPIKQLRKKDVEWLNDNYCRHRMPYLSHYTCFIEEKPNTCPFVEKVGYLDIESTNLKADFGYVFSYAILDGDSNQMLGRVLEPREIKSYHFDEYLMKELINDVKGFHRLCVYYGTHFDLPFLRTRCLRHGLSFPLYQDIYVSDVYYMVRNKLQLSRNRMENACQFFNIPSKGHRLNPDVWVRALAGDSKSLHYIWEHNKEDVISLKELHLKLESYVKKSKVSI